MAACGDSGPSFATDHPRVYVGANHDRLVAALASGAPAAMRFKDMVDRWVGGADIYGFEAWNAALLGQLTGDPKYCTAAVAAVDKLVATAESTIAGGGRPDVAAGDYYAIGDQVGDIALVYDWCYGAIPGDRRVAWLAFANQAVWNVWHADKAVWGGKPVPWTGWAVDDPGDNYYYGFLRATMLLGLAAHGEVDGADAWLTQFHDTKLMNQLVPAFDQDLVGGGSREGTGYGVSMRGLFELYDLWNASTGEFVATKTPHTRASLLAFIHATLPTLDRVAPTGDQSRDSTASFFDYHRNYVQELVALFPTDAIAPRAQALLAASSVPAMTEPFMYAYDFLYSNTGVAPSALDGLGTAYYAAGAGQLYARSGWDPHATWVNLIAGAYTETHAHQDQGAIMIYKDGWLAYDPVVDSHSGLTQAVDAHSTMRIVAGGTPLEQKLGTMATMVAVHRGDGWLHAAADLAPAYGGATQVQSLQREIVYLAPDCLVVYDRVATAAAAQQVWQLAMPKRPTVAGTQTTMTANGHVLHVERLGPTAATATVHDYTRDADFSAGFRLDETMAGGDNRWLHVVWIDNAVTAVVAHDASSASVTLANGTIAQIGFTPGAIGGALTLQPTAGGPTTVTLGAGIDPLPE